MLRRLAPLAVVVIAATALLSGCTAAHSTAATPRATATPSIRVGGGLPARSAAPTPAQSAPASAQAIPSAPPIAASSLVASASVASVRIHASAGGAVTTTMQNPQSNGTPLVFMVIGQQAGWVEVDVPVRPNGTTGWVQASDVSIASVRYHLVANTEANTLTLYDAGAVSRTFTVATGTGGTPTPHGSFYLSELLAPTNAGYGPYAYGISAFSNVLTSFGGGPGQIGLHGTDDASSIGKDASHGCIRLANADITTLAKLLPLGTPITII